LSSLEVVVFSLWPNKSLHVLLLVVVISTTLFHLCSAPATTTQAVEQTTSYPIDYTRAHQLISGKQDTIFVQDRSGLQVSAPVKSVYLGGKVAVTCKNDVIYVVQPCGSTRTIPTVNANGDAVKVLLNDNTNEKLTNIHIITCNDNGVYAANLTSDDLQIHEKFDFDNLTIWCENNMHYIKDKRTGKIVEENRGRREAKIGQRSSASEVTGTNSYQGRRE
ncbi:hypothetical protein PRIPAC_74389, partial [Pristionchus pacificus]